MVEITDADIGNVLTGIMRRVEVEYHMMTEAELERHWYFRFEPKSTLAWNMYQFNSCLTLYGGSCRRWEEIHNGSCCVVERVRDKYLMPKIKEFEQTLRNSLQQ